MRRYIVKWPDLELARNGKPGIEIGSELECTGLGTVPRNGGHWNRNWPGLDQVDSVTALLSCKRHSRCSKFQWSWCYTHLKTLWTADSEALVWRQGSLCPLNTSTRMQRPQKGSNLYVLQLIIKEVFRARQIQPCKSPYARSSNWMRGGDFNTDKCRVYRPIGRVK